MQIPKKQRSDKAKEAAAKKRAALAPIEEQWEKVLSMKSITPSERSKLEAVRLAMVNGEIGREEEALARGAALTKAEGLRRYVVLEKQENERELRRMRDEIPENYELITTKEALDDFIEVINAEDEIVFDVETTGVDIHSDYIVGHVLTAPKADRHVYIPVKHDVGRQLDPAYVIEKLRPIYENTKTDKIAHNAKFDIHMLANEGVTVGGFIWDTQVMCHVLNENEKSKQLKVLVSKYLQIPSKTYGDLFGKKGFNEVDLRTALAYAAKDGEVTLKLRNFQRDHMRRVGVLDYYMQVEGPLIPVVVRMERAGFRLDKERAEKLASPEAAAVERLGRQMREAFGVPDDFNFNSPAQLSKLLFDELKLEKALKGKDYKRTDAGKPATDKETLKLLADAHEGIELLLKYRKASKVFGTYFDKMPKRAQANGYVYAEFNQDATDTGRFNSREPNFQNMPAIAKTMFLAPKGYAILSGDFSQQEPRILTDASQEPFLLEVYRRGQDLYTMAASKLFNLPPEQCGDGSKWRKMMKTGMLATMYGTGPFTLAKQLDITVDEAKQFLRDFDDTYRHVARFMQGLVKECQQSGSIRMLMGRKRRVPTINSRDFREKRKAERQVKNSFVQGSAAIQTKRTMIALDEWCQNKTQETGKLWTIAFSIHDEIGAYIPEEYLTPEIVREYEDIMLNTVTLSVPNKTDIEISYRWGHGMTREQYFMARAFLADYEREAA